MLERIDEELEVDAVGEADLEVDWGDAEAGGLVSVLAIESEFGEAGFDLECTGVDGDGAFCSIGTIGGEWAPIFARGGVEQVVAGIVWERALDLALRRGLCDRVEGRERGEGGGRGVDEMQWNLRV